MTEENPFEIVATLIVDKLNEFDERSSSVMRSVGVVIFEQASQLGFKEQRKLVKTIKNSNALKLSPQFVYDCYRMVRKFPDMMKQDWKPLPNTTLSHHFEISRYKLTPGTEIQIIQDASDNNWSVREMKDEIRKYKQITETDIDKFRKSLMKHIYALLKQKSNEELCAIKDHIEDEYGFLDVAKRKEIMAEAGLL